MAFDKDACSAMTAAGTSGISDAMERLGLPRTVLTGFQCSVASGFAVAGTAFTVRQVPKHHPAQKDQRLVRHGEVSVDLAQPGDFVVIDAGGRTDIAGWGENHSRRCQPRGVAAALVNGATRDSAAIRRIGFPVFYLGISRSVVVAPNSNDADNACLLDALDWLGEAARGDCTRRCNHGGFEGAEWTAGAGGVLLSGQGNSVGNNGLAGAGCRAADLNWHLEIMPTRAAALMAAKAMLADLACPVVIGHLGYVPQPDGLAHPAFDTMRRLLDGGAWVKLLGVYFTSQKGFLDSGDVDALAAALAHHRPERVFWCTDWPHSGETTKPNDALLWDQTARWIPMRSSSVQPTNGWCHRTARPLPSLFMTPSGFTMIRR